MTFVEKSYSYYRARFSCVEGDFSTGVIQFACGNSFNVWSVSSVMLAPTLRQSAGFTCLSADNIAIQP